MINIFVQFLYFVLMSPLLTIRVSTLESNAEPPDIHFRLYAGKARSLFRAIGGYGVCIVYRQSEGRCFIATDQLLDLSESSPG